MKYDFIEIGCSDFETLIQEDCTNKTGVSIEPIKYYIDKLPNKDNIKKLNWAISDYNGLIDVYYINENNMKKYSFPDWVKGCNSVNKHHSSVLKLVKENNIPLEVFSIDRVEVHDIEYLFNFLDLESVQFLKIDCEGHDPTIVNSLINYCKNNLSKFPKLIEFENNELSDKEQIKELIIRLNSFGYEQIMNGKQFELQFKLK